jgi:hypothetical protein
MGTNVGRIFGYIAWPMSNKINILFYTIIFKGAQKDIILMMAKNAFKLTLSFL